MATSTSRKAIKDLEFGKGDFVVYPTHGVGKVTGIEEREIAGEKLQLFVVSFEKERMILRVPIEKVKESGLRKLSNRKIIDTALKTLKGKVRVKRTMWSRRAQEYEAKINSGDPVAIAEVVREKIVEGIADLRDESDRHGLRVVIEVRGVESEHVDPGADQTLDDARAVGGRPEGRDHLAPCGTDHESAGPVAQPIPRRLRAD